MHPPARWFSRRVLTRSGPPESYGSPARTPDTRLALDTTSEGKNHATGDQPAGGCGAAALRRMGAVMTSDPPAGAPDCGRPVRKSRGRAPDAALAGRYHARGVAHDIYVVRLTSLHWQVLD